MKKLILIISLLFLLSCTEQKQEQSQITNNFIMEQPNFNAVPWSTILLVESIGDIKIERMFEELKKGQFKDGKDFEKRMKGKLSPVMIGKIGGKFKFEVVVE